MVDYVKLAATAQRLILKNGKSISVVKLETAPADNTKPWRGPLNNQSPPADVQTLFAVEAALRKTLLGGVFSKRDIPDKVTDFFLAAPGQSTPDLTKYDLLTCGAVTYNIIEVDVLRPGSTVLLYYFMVAK